MKSREYLDTFVRRILQDAVCSAAAEQYEKRAALLEAVGTPRCDEMAEACRNAAKLWREEGPALLAEDLDNVLAEFPPAGWVA